MGNMMLAAPNRARNATFYSLGGWTSGLPIEYLATEQLRQVARACGADKRNTWLYIDLGEALPVQWLAACGHNLQTTGKVRWRGFATNPKAAIDLVCTGDTPPPGITTSRSDTAYYINRLGVLASAAAGVARVGWDLDTGLPLGLMYEPSATNLALRSRDGSNATWSKSSATAALTATGLDGVANAATTFTATGAGGQMTQTITTASATRRLSLYVKRLVGSGTVTITGDGFGTSTAIVPPSTKYKRFDIAVTGTNPVIGIRLGTNGDAVAVDFVQLEAGSVPTSPIPTTSGTASRTADAPRYLNAEATGLSFTTGTIVARAKLMSIPAALTGVCTLYASSTDQVGISHDATRIIFSMIRSSEQVAANGPLLAAGDAATCSMAWAVNNVRYSYNGGAAAQDTLASVPTGSAFTLNLGSRDGTVNHIGYIERVRVYTAALTDAQLQALSGTELEVAADFDSTEVDAFPAAWLAATTAEQRSGLRNHASHKASAVQTLRYWRLDLIDESNPQPLQFGRVVQAPIWQPPYQVAYGDIRMRFMDRDLVSDTYSGAEYGVKRNSPRLATFTMKLLTDANINELLLNDALVGTSGEVFWARDPDDSANLPLWSFIGRFMDLTDADAPQYNDNQKACAVKERL